MPHLLRNGVAVVTILLGAAACGGNGATWSPTAPSATPTVAGERWNLTATLRSFTGPEACVGFRPHTYVGQSSYWLMAIERSGESIHLVVSDVGDPTYCAEAPDERCDRYEYEGTVVADVLTAAVKSLSGATFCGGSRFDFRAEHHVSGRFSGDGRALTAEQVQSLQLSSGETLSLHYDWSATRQ